MNSRSSILSPPATPKCMMPPLAPSSNGFPHERESGKALTDRTSSDAPYSWDPQSREWLWKTREGHNVLTSMPYTRVNLNTSPELAPPPSLEPASGYVVVPVFVRGDRWRRGHSRILLPERGTNVSHVHSCGWTVPRMIQARGTGLTSSGVDRRNIMCALSSISLTTSWQTDGMVHDEETGASERVHHRKGH